MRFMTSPEQSQPMNNDVAAREDLVAYDQINEHARSHEQFPAYGQKFLHDIFGSKRSESAVSSAEVMQLDTGDVRKIIDGLNMLQQAAAEPDLLSNSARYRIGLYLIGKKDDEIAKIYKTTTEGNSNLYAKERAAIRKALNNERLPSGTKNAIKEARSQLIGRIIVEKKVAPARRQIISPASTKPNRELISVYKPADLLSEIADDLIRKKHLSKDAKQLLLRHFLDPENDLAGDERSKIYKSLGEIRAKLEDTLRLQSVTSSQEPLFSSLRFFRAIVGSSRYMPRSRAKITQAFLAKNPNVDIEAYRNSRDQMLGIALGRILLSKYDHTNTTDETAS